MDFLGFFGKKKARDEASEKEASESIDEALALARAQKRECDEWEKKYLNERQRGNTLRHLAHTLNTQKNLSALYESIVSATVMETNAAGGFLMRVEGGKLSLKCLAGSMTELTMKAIEGSEIFSGVLATGATLHLGREDKDTLLHLFAGTKDPIDSLVCAPLVTKYDKSPFGILGMVNKMNDYGFSMGDEEFLQQVSVEAAIAIKNMEYIADLEKKYDEIIVALAKAVELKDEYTHGHVVRVRDLSERLAQKLRLPPEQVRMIKIAATLHDVGKIAVPDAILQKKTELDELEWQQMKGHVIKSMEILHDISSLERDVVNMVLLHHEKFDGTGYPKGLKGQDIPIGAQILAIADVFDGMTTDRPYCKGLSEDAALEKMAGMRGTQFNPEFLQVFLEMMRQRVVARRVSQKERAE